MFYLTAINSIFDAQVCVWANVQQVSWAKDNNCILGGRRRATSLLYHRWNHRRCDGSSMDQITQRRWSRGWRRRWWRGSPRWRSATPRSSPLRRTASRDPSTSRTGGRAGTSSAGSILSPFWEAGAAFELLGEAENLVETSHVLSPARQAPPGSCS